MLDKLSLEVLERIGVDLSNNSKTHKEKQKILTEEAQNLVREGLANPESLTQFGGGEFADCSIPHGEGYVVFRKIKRPDMSTYTHISSCTCDRFC